MKKPGGRPPRNEKFSGISRQPYPRLFLCRICQKPTGSDLPQTVIFVDKRARVTREFPNTAGPDYIKIGFERIEDDLQFVVGCFREVLEDLGQTSIAEHLPWNGAPPVAGERSYPTKLGQAYSIAFQLLNMIEEGAAQAMRDLREPIFDSATNMSRRWLQYFMNNSWVKNP